jgi:glycine cleavage system regulatory protein
VSTSYILTFIGDDRPGLVEQLSSVVESNSGNWHESRLAELSGKFAGLVLISLPEENSGQLRADLDALAQHGLSVGVTPAASPRSGDGRDISLSLIGPDRLGIVREISRALADRQINVIEMDSHVVAAPMSGESLFKARIDARIPDNSDIDELIESLDEIAEQMTLEIDLDS